MGRMTRSFRGRVLHSNSPVETVGEGCEALVEGHEAAAAAAEHAADEGGDDGRAAEDGGEGARRHCADGVGKEW